MLFSKFTNFDSVLRLIGCAVLIVWLRPSFGAETVSFNRDIRPILADNCWACHGPDAGQRQADLRLDVAESAHKSVIKAGQPDQSLLIQKVFADDPDDVMPPTTHRKKLTPHQKRLLRDWVAQGGRWEEHWAWIPPVLTSQPGASVDQFIDVRLEREGLQRSPEADKSTLIRRLSFDIRGLPPSPEEVKDFFADGSESAYSELVDRFLASPSYGERMAVYWLDLVRYADTNGYHADIEWSVSPYRDYVIRSFNDNKRFDQFTREQIAGDLLPHATLEQRIAAGFNRLNMKSTEFGIQDKEYLARYAADRVRTTSTTWLGITLGCAECHDHKFDPFTARDFYRFAAFFADIKGLGYYPNAQGIGWGETLTLPNKELEAKLSSLEQQLAEIPEQEKEQRQERQNAIDRLKKQQVTMLATVSVAPRPTRILPRGNWMDESGPIVTPATPAFFRYAVEPTPDNASDVLTRLDLANWISSPRNPLTARVFMNRLWKLFFGSGLAPVLDDIGSQGAWPTHPELLDWLAVEFVESGFDVKHMVRLIVNSRTYRQASLLRSELVDADPENRLLARQSRFRLDAEFIRDNALAVSGLLIPTVGGKSVKPYQPAGYWENLNFPRRKYVADTGTSQYRRGVYTHWQRQFLHPALVAFDAPSREECTADRSRSNTPLAALVLLNDPSQVEAARVLAENSVESGGSDGQRIRRMVFRVLSRPAAAAEVIVLKRLLSRHRDHFAADAKAAGELVSVGQKPVTTETDLAELAAWTSVARSLLNLHETITRY